MSDNELIAGCIKDDRRCQNELYKKYFPLMSNLALRYTNDSDEAIHKLNSGFLKILQNLSKFDSQYSLATFIRNILVNHLIDEFRKEKKYFANIQLAEYSETEAGSSYNLGEINLEAGELFEILNHLPEMTRKVFNLFAIDGYQHNEIAEMLEISNGTSKWHVSEARKKLKEVLEMVRIKEKKRSETV